MIDLQFRLLELTDTCISMYRQTANTVIVDSVGLIMNQNNEAIARSNWHQEWYKIDGFNTMMTLTTQVS